MPLFPPYRTRTLGAAGGGGAEVLPTDFAGLVAWYDATDPGTLWTDTAGTSPASNGSQVRRWDDKSGNGQHITNGTATNTNIQYNTSGFGPSSLANVDLRNTANSFLTSLGANFALSAPDQCTLVMLIDSDEPAPDFAYLFGLTSLVRGIFYQTDVSGGTGPGYFDNANRGFGVGSVVDFEAALVALFTEADSELYNQTTLIGSSGTSGNFSGVADSKLRMGISTNATDVKVVKLALYDAELATADWQSLVNQWAADAGL